MVTNLKAYSSLLNFESSINLFYRIYGFDMDNSSILTKLLNLGAKKELATVPATKLPLEVDHVKQFINICDPGNPFEVTFCAAIQVGFMALLRRSNICPPSVSAFDPAKHLLRKDIELNGDGVTVNLRWSKTNQSADQTFSIPIAHSGNGAFDPPQFYKDFASNFPVLPQDPCFSFYGWQTLCTVTERLVKFPEFISQQNWSEL